MSKKTIRKPSTKTREHELSRRPRPSARAVLAICIFIVLATTAVYVQVAWFPFIDYDDAGYVRQNHFVSDPITARSIHWAFTAFHSANWHPLTWISHMIDCQIYGLHHPGGHHVTNVILHIVNALLLFLVLLRLTGATWRSGFVAALFALHPLHVESVAWVSERKDLLSTLFWMLTVLAYVQYVNRRGIGRYLLVFCLYALGLMAKPMLVSLPLILLLLDWWPLSRLKTQGATLRYLIIEKIPLFALALGSCFLTYVVQLHGRATQTLLSYPLGVRTANALFSYLAYIWKMVWPARLAIPYPHVGATLPTWQVVASAAVVASLTVLAVSCRRKLPYLFVGWLWFLVMLIPAIGLVQVGWQGMADRYTYVPLVGLFLIVTWGVSDAVSPRVKSPAGNMALAALAIALLGGLAVRSWVQVGYWKSNTAFYRHSLLTFKGNDGVRVFVAESLQSRGKLQEAIRLLPKAPANNVAAAQVYNTLGLIRLQQRRFTQAEACFKRAINARPDLPAAHANLGAVLQLQGRTAEAMDASREAIALDRRYPDPHVNLALMHESLGETDDALSEFDKAAALDPENAEARWRAALILNQQGLADEAVSRLRDAVYADPHCFQAQYLLGCILRRQGSASEAIEHLNEAAKINPRAGAPHYSLAMALLSQGDCAGAWREAKLARKLGVRLAPEFLKALSQRMPEPGR